MMMLLRLSFGVLGCKVYFFLMIISFFIVKFAFKNILIFYTDFTRGYDRIFSRAVIFETQTKPNVMSPLFEFEKLGNLCELAFVQNIINYDFFPYYFQEYFNEPRKFEVFWTKSFNRPRNHNYRAL